MCLGFLWVADLIQIVYERLTYLSLMQSRYSPCQCWTQPQGMLENGLPEGHLWVRTLSMPCACLVLSQVPDVSRFKLLDKTLNNDSVESQVIWIVNFIKEGEWLIGTSCGNALSLIVHHNNHKHLFLMWDYVDGIHWVLWRWKLWQAEWWRLEKALPSWVGYAPLTHQDNSNIWHTLYGPH